jgi:hypothetical protein
MRRLSLSLLLIVLASVLVPLLGRVARIQLITH